MRLPKIIFYIAFIVFLMMNLTYSETLLCVDAGHGYHGVNYNYDLEGAPGLNGTDYPNEQHIVLRIALSLENNLWDDFGMMNVYMTRLYEDVYVTNNDRVLIARGDKADAYGYVVPRPVDIFISVHCDAHEYDATFHGTSMHIYDNEEWELEPNTSTTRYIMAQQIISSCLSSTEEVFSSAKTAYNTTGIVGRNAQIYMLQSLYTTSPNTVANLIECEFVTNPDTWDVLTAWYFDNDYSYVEAAGSGIADGIVDYVDLITSIGDGLSGPLGSTDIEQGLEYYYEAYFTDIPPQTLVVFSEEMDLVLPHNDGKLTLECETISHGFDEFNNAYWTIEIPELPTGYSFFVDSERNIRGELKVEAYANGETYENFLEIGYVINELPSQISSNYTVDGYYKASSNVNVSNNSTLFIEPGSGIYVDAGKKITVESGSNITASGTQSLPIFFTSINSNPSMSDWFGIRVYGEADINYTTVEYTSNGLRFEYGATGSISNSTFSDNYYSVYVNSASPTIQNCEIKDNLYGLLIYSSYPSPDWNTIHISNNSISNNTSYGLYLYNSSPTLSGNVISSNSRSALWIGSNPILDDNDFKNSTHYGLACFGSCSPSMYLNGSLGGHNTIIYNGAQGIRITASSDPILGRLNPSMGGYNSIYSNSGYEIDNTTSNSIMAMQNWWGSAAGPGSDYTGSVDWLPPLSYDPNDPLKPLAGDFSVDPNSDLPVNLQMAYYEQSKQNYAAAAEGFRNHFVNMKGSRFNARSVVQFIKSLSYFQTPVEIVKEIDALFKNDLDVVTRFELLSGKANQCILAQNPGEALNALNEALKDKLTNENVNRIYLQNAMIYAYSLNDKSVAEKYFNMLIENSEKNSDYYLVAEEEITNLNKTFSKSSGEYVQTESVLEPDKYSLLQNYPNPFNPETKIRFNLPEDSQVKLEVYNIQGQKVITLVDKMLSAGIHTANFNGSNFSSGIYFYKIVAGEYLEVKRMLLIK